MADVSITVIGGSLYQWDKLRDVTVSGISNITDLKVHFSTKKNNTAFVVLPIAVSGGFTARIPSLLLTYGQTIQMYIYKSTSGVVNKFDIPVIPRDKPSDYIYDSYEENQLQWPYEEDIEELLRKGYQIIDAASNEPERDQAEQLRQDAERLREQNEIQRQATLARLQSDLNSLASLRSEVVAARGGKASLKTRIDEIANRGSVTSIKLSGNDLIVSYADGRSETITNIASESNILSIEKIGTEGLVDTYSIALDTGRTFIFTVTNGAQGQPGQRGPAVWSPKIESTDSSCILSWVDYSDDSIVPAPVNIKGDTGSPGLTYTPVINQDYVLSWVRSDNSPDVPRPINVRGPSTAYVGESRPSDPEVKVWINPTGVVPDNIVAVSYIPSINNGVLSWERSDGRYDAIPDPVTVVGSKGRDGAYFTPSVSNGMLRWTNNGGLTNPDPVNITGKPGAVFIPTITNGILNWTNDAGLENPSPVTVVGEAGPYFIPQFDISTNVLSWIRSDGDTDNVPDPVQLGGNAATLGGKSPSYFAEATHTHPAATSTSSGFFSATDKAALSRLTSGNSSDTQNVDKGANVTFGNITCNSISGAVYE